MALDSHGSSMLHGKTTPHRGRDRGIDVQISVPSTDLAALRWEVAMIAFWLKGSDKGKKTTRAGVKGKKTRAPSALSLMSSRK